MIHFLWQRRKVKRITLREFIERTLLLLNITVTMTENGVMLSPTSAERPMATKQFNVFNIYWLLLRE